MEPMEVFFDDGAPAAALPPPLAALYGGGLALATDVLYANVVASLDGVAAVEGAGPAAMGLLRAGSEADRFVVALLRSLADAVVIGAGTLRAHPRHRFTAAGLDRARAGAYAGMGRPEARLVVVSASGRLDPAHPALRPGTLVLTTDAGRAAAAPLPGLDVRSLGPDLPDGPSILAAVRADGHRRVLTEGGPTLLGHLAGVLDELFLTTSPVLAGRRDGDGRLGLIAGVHLLPPGRPPARLRSLRRAGSHLFARYSLSRPVSA